MSDKILAYLIDRDGVLTNSGDGKPITGAVTWMNRLIKSNIDCLVATNHTTSSPMATAHDLASIGYDVTLDLMHTPLSILFDYFRKKPPGKVLVSGTNQLKSYLRSQKIELVDSARAETLLMGFNREMTYDDLRLAIESVHVYGANFIALHQNRLYKTETGHFDPGLGAWVKAVEYATNVKPLIVGKPNSYYFKTALERMHTEAKNTVMISDDPFSDLTGAKIMGLKTIFVTSGKYTDKSVLDQIPAKLQPDMVYDTISQVPQYSFSG
ncbi:HAD-IIA family hydrolase [bacterium]|nr:HAD-IIA family hydrolase [bacterium]